MWPFTRQARKEKVDETYETRLERVEKATRECKAYVIDIQTDIDTLRDKVLRKIQAPRTTENNINERTPSNAQATRTRRLGGKSAGLFNR